MSSIGEYDRIEDAERVGRALQAATPGSTFVSVMKGGYEDQRPRACEYVIVAVHTFQVDTKAYFAQTEKEAEDLKIAAEKEHGTEFRIYSR